MTQSEMLPLIGFDSAEGLVNFAVTGMTVHGGNLGPRAELQRSNLMKLSSNAVKYPIIKY